MKKDLLSDQQIIEGLLGTIDFENKALAAVYSQNKEKIMAMIIRKGGRAEMAKDIFQEAIIVFYENVKKGKFRQDSTISTYLHSIARYLLLNQLKGQKSKQLMLEQQTPEPPPIADLDKWLIQEQRLQFQQLFDQLGTNCKQVLVDNIYYGYSMKEIAQRMDYENEQVIRNRKYQCLKQLKKLLTQRPDLIQLLKDLL